MDYSTWEEKPISVSNLSLDPRNPRIPPTNEPLSQRELIAELVAHDKVYELAQNIVRNGFFPVESLIVVREGGNIIVIEGNRRLAALRLLISPDAAPEEQVPRFRALSSRIDRKAIKKVKVLVAPNRQVTAPIVMSRHTDSQIERWDTVMQASYYKNLLQNGITADDICEQYHLQRNDVIRSLQLHDMYQIACTLDLPSDIAEIVHNPRKFKVTNLQRFYERPVSQKFLGIELSNETPDILGTIDKAEFIKGFTRIVSDVATNKLNSRIIEKTEHVRKYISENIPAEEIPDLAKRGSFTADTLFKDGTEIKTIAPSVRGKTTRRPRRISTGLIPRGISCEVNNSRIYDVFSELKTLPVVKYRNATAVLLRSLLEMTLAHYLHQSGELYSIINDEKQRLAILNKPLRRNWHPSLKRMLTYITSPQCGIIQNPNMKSVIEKFTKQKGEFISHDDMNFFVHNQFYAPTEDQLRSIWGQLENLFQIILVEPDTN